MAEEEREAEGMEVMENLAEEVGGGGEDTVKVEEVRVAVEGKAEGT